jgi:hypothetical protein
MAITYTWKVKNIRTATEGSNVDAIVNTYWELTGTDEDGNTGTFQGATPFTSANVPEGEFIPLAELTEETVLGWIRPVVTGEYDSHVKRQIQKAIDQAKGQRAYKAMPWAPEVAVPPTPNVPVAPEA